MRIASLIPSATEIVAALGAADALVGRSHECDHPPGVERLPVLTAPKIDLGGSSRAIDRQVRDVLREAASVYRIDTARLRALQPDVVLTQSQCEVCAVHLDDVTRAVRSWTDGQPAVVALEPHTLDDVWDDVRRVAQALGRADRGASLVRRLTRRMRRLTRQVAGRPRPSVACLEWIDPLMAAGGWIPTLVEQAGGRPVLSAPNAPTPRITWDDLRAADPDVIVVMACGFGLDRTRAEVPALTKHAGWSDLRAVQAGRVVLADGNHYFNRPGPRLADSQAILAEVLHPEAVAATHHGTGWQRLLQPTARTAPASPRPRAAP